MAHCKTCGKNIPDGTEYCSECEAKRKADESYLDSLLSSVVTNRAEKPVKPQIRSTAKPVEPRPMPVRTKPAAKPEIPEQDGKLDLDDNFSFDDIPEEDIAGYDILNDSDDSFLEELFPETKETEGAAFDEEASYEDSPVYENTPTTRAAEKSNTTTHINEEAPQQNTGFSAYDTEEEPEPQDMELLNDLLRSVDETQNKPEAEQAAAYNPEAIPEAEYSAEAMPETEQAAAYSMGEMPEAEYRAEEETGDLPDFSSIPEETINTDEEEMEAIPVPKPTEEEWDEEAPEELFEEAKPVPKPTSEEEEDEDIDQMIGDLFQQIEETEPDSSATKLSENSKVSIVEEEPAAEEEDDILDFWNSINGDEAEAEPETEDTAGPLEEPALAGAAVPAEPQEEPEGAEDYLSMVPDRFPEEEPEAVAPQKEQVKKKKRGLLARLFGNVKEDISEEELENRKKAALEKFEEDELKAAELAELEKNKKTEKKQQKEEQSKQNKEQKAIQEKEKKEKQLLQAEQKKELKDKKEQARRALLEEIEQNEGKINKVGASFVFVIFAAILCFIAIGTSVYTYRVAIDNATFDFELQRYQDAYEEVYGLDIKEEDQELYDKIMTVQYVNTQLISYMRYTAFDMDAEALDSLIKGLRRYEKYIYLGTQLGINSDLDYLKTQILNELEEAYQINELQAYSMLNIASQEEYSAMVYDIVSQN